MKSHVAAGPTVARPLPRRIVVIGAVGSGKTTLGRRAAAALGLPFVDIDRLDALPGWRHRALPDFQRLLRERVATDAWVMAGDFAATAGPIVWPQAEQIVWLDLPRAVTLWRTASRTLREVWSGEPPYPGSRQTPASIVRTGLIGMTLRHPGKKRRSHPRLLRSLAAPGTSVWRLTSRRSVESWLTALEAGRPDPPSSPAG